MPPGGKKQYIMYINLDLFFIQPECHIRFVSRNPASDLVLSPDLPVLSLSVCLFNEACFVFFHFICHLFSALSVVVLLMSCFRAGFAEWGGDVVFLLLPPYLPLPAHSVLLLPQHHLWICITWLYGIFVFDWLGSVVEHSLQNDC